MLIDLVDASEAREDDENFKNAVDLLLSLIHIYTEQQKQENINIQGSGVMPDSRHVIHPRVM